MCGNIAQVLENFVSVEVEPPHCHQCGGRLDTSLLSYEPGNLPRSYLSVVKTRRKRAGVLYRPVRMGMELLLSLFCVDVCIVLMAVLPDLCTRG